MYIFISSRKVIILYVWEGHRAMKDANTDWRGTAILTFSKPTLWFLFPSLTSLLPWRKVLNRGLPGYHLAIAPLGKHWPWLFGPLTWVPVYIYFHKTYTFRLWFTWSTSTCQLTRALLLLTQQEHPVSYIPDWQLCQGSICNAKTKTYSMWRSIETISSNESLFVLDYYNVRTTSD